MIFRTNTLINSSSPNGATIPHSGQDKGQGKKQVSPEQLQKQLDNKVNEVLALLNGLTVAQCEAVLNSTLVRLPYQSYVQSHSLPQ